MIGRPEWADDRTLDSVVGRTERCDELNPVIRAWTTARTTAEIVELATLLRIPCIEVGNGETIPQMDHFAADGSTTSTRTAASSSRRRRSGCTRRSPASPRSPARPPLGAGDPTPSSRPTRRPVACTLGGPAGHPAVRGAPGRRLHVVLGRAVPRPHARHVRRRRHPRRVDGPARRRPADEPPPADRRRSGGSARRTSTPPTPTSAASRSTCPATRVGSWPGAWSPSATCSSRTTARG